VIEQFIEATRGPGFRANVDPSLAATYQFNFRWIIRCLDSLISSGPYPVDRLLVVNTPAAQAETIEMGGERVIVYDQYLRQVMNTLNRLLFDQAEVREVDAYLCKLFALRYLASGRPSEAIEYACVYDCWSDRLRKPDPASAEECLRFTAVQECFILAHEIAHCIVDYGGWPVGEAYAWWISVTSIEAKDADKAHRKLRADRVPERLKRDFFVALDRRFGPATEDELRLRRSMFEEVPPPRALRPDVETHIQMITRVLSDLRLAEECLCDGIALNVTVLWATKVLRMRANHALRAAIVGLHHLRLLCHMDALASAVLDTPDNIRFSVSDTQTRLSLARLTARSFTWLPTLGQRRVKLRGATGHVGRLQKELRYENERYTAVIWDQLVWGLFQDRVKPMIELFRAPRNVFGDAHGSTDLRARVLAMCNLDEFVDPALKPRSSLFRPSHD
jgi:hypothetical protein